MNKQFPRIVIAGLRGGSGKTILALGLAAAWHAKGITVIPFKKGPDYIDAGWLSSASRQPCYNLDPFLVRKKMILSSFAGHFGQAACSVIEGNRGLYDGMDSAGTYSTAELAKMLGAPVLLIVDCTKATRTVSAMVFGMKKFDRKVHIAGVVLNRIAGKRHASVIRDAIEDYCGIPVLGAIPKLKDDFLSERHMGLMPFQEHPDVKKVISCAADIARKYIDIKKIWKIACGAGPLPRGATTAAGAGRGRGRLKPRGDIPPLRIGIIRDAAFQFYYPENFEELKKRGAELVEISAMKAEEMPHVDALYIGGGFPETHAISLAENSRFRKALQRAVEGGLPVYAECGGLMYLGRSIQLGGRTYPMADVFPIRFSLEKKPQAHGYTVVEATRSNPFYDRGAILKGHEFHYSKVAEIGKKQGMYFALSMKRGKGIFRKRDGVCYRNALATYTHLHALGSPEWADGLIRRAALFRHGKAASRLS